MHIGMFCNAYKPVISGVVRSIDLYRQGLRQSGHFVALFAPDSKGYEDDEAFVFRYPALSLPIDIEYTFPVIVAPQITWLMPRLKLDILHSHHPMLVGKEAVSFGRELDVPIVFTFHTMYHEYTHYLGVDADIVKQIVRRLIGDYVRKVDRVIAPSARVRDLLPSYRVEGPVDILPTPVDLTLFPRRDVLPFSDPDRIDLIYVGRIAKEKNVELMLQAFARAARQDQRLYLRVIGDGPELAKLQADTIRMQIQSRVEFTGAIPFKQVPLELSRADMFIFCSTTETQGLVILEAMAAGLPLVIVRCPALLDVAQHNVDTIVAREDEQDVAQAILSLARDSNKAQAMGKAARANARRYSVPALSSRLVDIYQDTIDGYHRNRHL